MKKNDASERAAALVHQAIDVLQRAVHAPGSPVNAFVPAKDGANCAATPRACGPARSCHGT